MNLSFILIVSLSIEIVFTQTSSSNYDTGIDRSGPWYAHIQTALSPEACCAFCNAEGFKCQSWVYVRVGASNLSSGCYLQQNIPSINEGSSCGQFCSSGYKQSSLIINGRCAYPGGIFELGVDRPGSNYTRLTSIQSHPACCAMCQMEGSKCRAWTFVRDGAPNRESGCFLKSSIPSASRIPCVPCTSGTK